ncbi:unnamed protein product [Cuscuta europaea]|uniref:UDP-glucose iridoid glucosyltransferase-like n=1 Tax=Cuscuta europaea TaxID=41803 RepID=A0A9P0YW80_CUSEU|nr:unnamed protein product [Cuscuta europaea]
MEMEGGAEKRGCLVLVPYPFQGHMTPMLQLGHTLNSKGFSIIVAHTQFNAPDPKKHPEFTFHGLADGIPASDLAVSGTRLKTKFMNENCRAPLEDFLKEKGSLVSCVIYDTAMSFVDQVAALLNLPSIVLRPYNAVFLQALLHILENEETISLIPESRLEDPIPEFHPVRYQDIPYCHDSEEVKSFIWNIIKIRPSSLAMIWNTVEELERTWLSRFQQHYNVPIFPVGPLHKIALAHKTSLIEEDDSCLAWLDKQASQSVLFVGVSGSLATIGQRDFEEIAWGLADSNQPFLWAVRPGSVNEKKDEIIEDFEKKVGNRGRLVKWAPQKDVLAHGSVGGFWSHCGWNSTLESISEGMPMICKPLIADQFVNARFLVHEWKVGLALEEVERSVIADTVRKLMVGDERKELKQNAMEMKRKMADCLQKGGSSYKALNELTNFISSLPRRTSICGMIQSNAE